MKSLLKYKIDKIAQCLYLDTKKKEINNFGLYFGSFGQLLFLLYYSNSFKSKNDIIMIENYVEKLLIQFAEKENDFTFGYGLAGELYLLDFLREQNIIDLDIGNVQSVFENHLLDWMRKNMQNNYYDFMHGAVGAGLYFLKRGLNKEYILELINFLYNSAEKNDNNTIFKWESNLIYGEEVTGYNLSMSHGISSIIIFLSRIIKSGILNEKIQLMLAGAINYIISQELDFSQFGFSFPNYVLKNPSDTFRKKSPLAWCYGDLGIGIALWQAGIVTKTNKWKEKALEIFLKCARRLEIEKISVLEAGICHGSAGIAMIFRRMHIITQNDEFEKASIYWLNQTLNLSQFEDGLAGYKTLMKNNESICDYSLLTGISGIGLILLSYLNDDKQSWDELFLLS